MTSTLNMDMMYIARSPFAGPLWEPWGGNNNQPRTPKSNWSDRYVQDRINRACVKVLEDIWTTMRGAMPQITRNLIKIAKKHRVDPMMLHTYVVNHVWHPPVPVLSHEQARTLTVVSDMFKAYEWQGSSVPTLPYNIGCDPKMRQALLSFISYMDHKIWHKAVRRISGIALAESKENNDLWDRLDPSSTTIDRFKIMMEFVENHLRRGRNPSGPAYRHLPGLFDLISRM